MAAGLTIKEENFPAFVHTLTEVCGRLIENQLLTPSLRLDEQISLGDFSWELLRWHDLLQPFWRSQSPATFSGSQRGVDGAADGFERETSAPSFAAGWPLPTRNFFGGNEGPIPDPPWDIAFRIGSEDTMGK